MGSEILEVVTKLRKPGSLGVEEEGFSREPDENQEKVLYSAFDAVPSTRSNQRQINQGRQERPESCMRLPRYGRGLGEDEHFRDVGKSAMRACKEVDEAIWKCADYACREGFFRCFLLVPKKE